MKTLSVVKRVIDIIYEAEQSSDAQLIKPNLTKSALQSNLEKEIKEKDKLIAELYKENIKLENRIRQYEQELDVFSSLNKSSQEENEVVEPSDKQEEVSKEEVKLKAEKISRKEYMKEYSKNYRKKQKEKKLEVNL